ncbi:hypothetical protein DMUE_0420 [Dictyocoela muelleri]|nr:hypothetical protein DMUE_0420 [Dictyocoela muelleri]
MNDNLNTKLDNNLKPFILYNNNIFFLKNNYLNILNINTNHQSSLFMTNGSYLLKHKNYLFIIDGLKVNIYDLNKFNHSNDHDFNNDELLLKDLLNLNININKNKSCMNSHEIEKPITTIRLQEHPISYQSTEECIFILHKNSLSKITSQLQVIHHELKVKNDYENNYYKENDYYENNYKENDYENNYYDKENNYYENTFTDINFISFTISKNKIFFLTDESDILYSDINNKFCLKKMKIYPEPIRFINENPRRILSNDKKLLILYESGYELYNLSGILTLNHSYKINNNHKKFDYKTDYKKFNNDKFEKCKFNIYNNSNLDIHCHDNNLYLISDSLILIQDFPISIFQKKFLFLIENLCFTKNEIYFLDFEAKKKRIFLKKYFNQDEDKTINNGDKFINNNNKIINFKYLNESSTVERIKILLSGLIKIKREIEDLKNNIDNKIDINTNSNDVTRLIYNYKYLILDNMKIIYFDLKTLIESFHDKEIILMKMENEVKEGIKKFENKKDEIKSKSKLLIMKINKLKYIDDDVKDKILNVKNLIKENKKIRISSWRKRVLEVLKIQNLILLSKFE